MGAQRARREGPLPLPGPPRRGHAGRRSQPQRAGPVPGRFATQALAALPGFKAPLEPGKPERLGGTPLEAVQAAASGTTKDGDRERATLVTLRRDALVNYTVAMLQNAEQPASADDRGVALRMVRTLRDQP